MCFRRVPLTFGIDPISLKRKLALSLNKKKKKNRTLKNNRTERIHHVECAIIHITTLLHHKHCLKYRKCASHPAQFIIMRSESGI